MIAVSSISLRRFQPILTSILVGAFLSAAITLPLSGQAVVVMTRDTPYSNQFLYGEASMPWVPISQYLRASYSITDLTAGPGGWVTVSSMGEPVMAQSLDTARAARTIIDRVTASKDKRIAIGTLGWGPGGWVAVLSRTLVETSQKYLTGTAFPQKEVDAEIKRGLRVTAMEHGADGWVVVMTDKTGWGEQHVLQGKDFPEDAVDASMKAGYAVTDMAQSDSLFAVVMTKGTGWGQQMILTDSEIPTAEIQSTWLKSYHITEVEWKPTSAFRIQANNLEIEERLEQTADLNTGIWYDEFINNNGGTERGFVAVQRMAGYYVTHASWGQAAEIYHRYRHLFPTMDKRFDAILAVLQAEDLSQVDRISNLGSGVNTFAGEFMPLPTADGEALYFTGMNRRGGPGGEDIYVSRLRDSAWSPADAVPGKVNTVNHEFGTAISADNNRLVLFAARAEGVGSGDLYYSDRTKEGWGELKSFPVPINSEHWDCDGFLTSDGKALLFATDRPGGIGEYHRKDVPFRGERWGNTDLYVVVRKGEGWSEPINLGAVINTPVCERSPFLHPDGKTLYFASSGHPGLGKLDIFVSTRLKEDSWTEWSEPVNLGKLINGIGSDWGYRVNTSGTTAFFAADNQPRTFGFSDLYALAIPQESRPEQVATVRGVVTDPEGKPLVAAIKWDDLMIGKNVGELSTDPVNGRYFITLQLGKNFGYYAEKEGYYPVSNNLDLRERKTGLDTTVNIVMAPIEKIVEEGMNVRLNNIFFDYDKATLKSESRAELDRFADLLRAYPNAQIEIAGHTDSVASDTYNKDLSQRRAQSVVDYLVSKGIPRKNLEAKGYGESKPVANNGTNEGRAMNRRVEFQFLKTEGTKKTSQR